MCGSLNKNDTHRPIYLTIWPLIAGTVWKGLGGLAMVEEVCQWGQVLRFQKTLVCLTAAGFPTMMGTL